MIIEVTDQNFGTEVLTGQDIPVLVDFWAPWCGPCRMMAPVLDQISTQFEGKVKVAKLNTDDNQTTAGKYRITGIPCMILFKNGKEIDRIVGYNPPDALAAKLNSHI